MSNATYKILYLPLLHYLNLEPWNDNPFQQLSWSYPGMMTCCVSVKGAMVKEVGALYYNALRVNI